jgi:hypothetical protein
MRAKLGFLGFDPLLTGVEPALAAYAMRTLRAATLRARLDGDGRCGLVGVARALLTLRCTSLRDGHGSRCSKWVLVLELSCGAAELLQRVPARIRALFVAIARTFVQIRAAARAEPLAIFTTQRERRRRQQPLLPNSRTKIQLRVLRVEAIHVGIVCLLSSAFGENEVCFVVHVRGRVGKTTATLESDVSFDPAMPVKPARSRRRQTPGDVHRRCRPWVALFPHGIVGGQLLVNDNCMGFERPDVKGQHPLKLANSWANYKLLASMGLGTLGG